MFKVECNTMNCHVQYNAATSAQILLVTNKTILACILNNTPHTHSLFFLITYDLTKFSIMSASLC